MKAKNENEPIVAWPKSSSEIAAASLVSGDYCPARYVHVTTVTDGTVQVYGCHGTWYGNKHQHCWRTAWNGPIMACPPEVWGTVQDALG